METYHLKIPENLISLIGVRTKIEHVDELTAVRELLYLGAENYCLELYGKGYLSIGKTAELLNKSVYDVIRLAQKKGIKTGATLEQQKISEKTAMTLE